MKKQYQHPKMNLVEIDEWQCVVCTSPEYTRLNGVPNPGYGEDDSGGFFQGEGAPRRNGPWDE